MKSGLLLFVLAAQTAVGQSWVDASGGTHPPLSVFGGKDEFGSPVFICRITDGQGRTQVGRISASQHGCLFNAGNIVSAESYQVLTDFSVDWKPATSGTIPDRAYNAAASGNPAYVCRAYVEQGLYVGQLRIGSPGCAIAYADTGGYFTSYEVLYNPWVDRTTAFASGAAVPTGVEPNGSLIYSCRSNISNSFIGNTHMGDDHCGYAGQDLLGFVFGSNVLTGVNPTWQTFDDSIPEGSAFYAGSQGGLPKYICRVGNLSLGTIPGQTGGTDGQGGCYVEYNNTAGHTSHHVEILMNSSSGVTCHFSVLPASIVIPPGGSSATVALTTNCGWVNSSNASWLVSSPRAGSGNGSFTLTVGPNTGTQRSSILSVGGTTIPVTQDGCNYAIVSASGTVSHAGGTASVLVNTSAGCPVSFTPSASWVQTNAPGTGSGVYHLTVSPNTTFVSRSQTVRVGGSSYTLSQEAAPCSFQNVSTPAALAKAGGSFTLTFSVVHPSCQWTVSTTSNFLHLGTTSGSGTGSINVTFDANPNASARAGSINLNTSGASFGVNINQQGATCTYSVSPTGHFVAVEGGNQTVQVTTASSCTWTASSGDPSWVTFPGSFSGTGSGPFVYSVAPNSGASRRTTILVGGQTVEVSQSAPSCTYTLTSNAFLAPASAATTSVNVQTAAGCTWRVVSTADWINITSGSVGTGNGTVRLDIAANNTGSTRASTLSIAGRNFTVTQSGNSASPAGSGLTFVSLTPCRILETRAEYNFEGRTGNLGPPSLNNGEVRTLPMNASSLCPIPTLAKAYVVNITLVPKGTLDFATVWPAGETRPNVWTIRSPDGNIVANSAIVKAGSNGAISVYASHATDMLIDVTGYFTDNTAVSNLVYYPLTPCRVVDTRILYRPEGPFGAPSIETKQTRRFGFPDTPFCNVPSNASAYSMTITAVPKGGPLQFITAWPGGASQPNVSSINSPAGRVLANSVILPAGSDGSVDVYAFDATDFLIDINGYFAPNDGATGLFYFPVTQCRASDSSVSGGIYPDDSTRNIEIPSAPGCSGIPATAKGYALNVTALPNNRPMPFLTAYPKNQNRPNASILNAFEGQIVSNSAIVPAGDNGGISVYAFRQTNVVVDVSGYFSR